MNDTLKYRHRRDNTKVDKSEVCSYCGKKGHGSTCSSQSIRQKECTAYGHTCKHCNIDHHYDSMCRGKNKTKPKTLAKPVQRV